MASSPNFIRNLTTLGHVDHGKTTLMDSLLASNNIISTRMALTGKVRYMDSREDEQERGITMESSAVGLKFRVKDNEVYTLNMIDTPGHIDFQSEVSSASRLCDGALVLVDVVEGVQTQTTSLLRQAYLDKLHPVLVLNKIDRLIGELKLGPEEAYERLWRVVEDVNVVMGEMWGGERMKRMDEEEEGEDNQRNDQEAEGHDDDSSIYFDPAQGNVIFSSAIDGWGFRPSHFARIFARRLFAEQTKSGSMTMEALKEKEEGLKKVMWGEWYFDPKAKRIVGPKSKRLGMKPLFVSIILENLWKVYDAVGMGVGENNTSNSSNTAPDKDKILKIISTLGLTLPPREMRALQNLSSTGESNNAANSKQILQNIFSTWLPLSTAIVQAVIDVVPPPGAAQARKMGGLLGLKSPSFSSNPTPNRNSPSGTDGTDDATTEHRIYSHLFTASISASVPVCAYVSKMFAVRRSEVPEEKEKERAAKVKASKEQRNPTPISGTQASGDASTPDATPADTLTAEPERKEGTTNTETEDASKDDDILLGFARIYSGTLSVGKRVCVLLPKFNPTLESSILSADNLESSLATLDVTDPSTADGAKSDVDSGIAKLSVHPSNMPYILGLPSYVQNRTGSSSSSAQNLAPAVKTSSPSSGPTHPTLVKIRSLYLMMGRELVPVQSVSAGQIFAVRFYYSYSSSLTTSLRGLSNAEGAIDGIADAAAAMEVEVDDQEGIIWRSGTIVSPVPQIGVNGDGGAIARSGNLGTKSWLVNLGRVSRANPPIVRVSLLPAIPGELPALLRGLKILEQADPCVETFQMDGGEWVIGGAGELHLERCIKDLRERYAKIEIHASKPIVPFRETAVRELVSMGDTSQPESAQEQQQQQQFQLQKQFQGQFGSGVSSGPTGTITASTSQSLITFTIRAVPLPEAVKEFIGAKRRRGVLGRLKRVKGDSSDSNDSNEGHETAEERTFWSEFAEICENESSAVAKKERHEKNRDVQGEAKLWKMLSDAASKRVWAFGPLGGASARGGSDHSSDSGPDITEEYESTDSYGTGCILVDARTSAFSTEKTSSASYSTSIAPLIPHIITGFNLATRQGPLCAEPVEGIGYFVEKVDIDMGKVVEKSGEGMVQENAESSDTTAIDPKLAPRYTDPSSVLAHPQTTGSLISSVRDACKSALLEWSPRLMLAMYSCDIQCSTDVLGRVYGVLSKRKGRVIAEEMKEGTSFFTITARIPVVESFGFADELRKRTSGAAGGVILVFSGYDLLPLSPFWIPSTVEELEDLGTTSDRANVAKIYMDNVRERKGMWVDRKLILEGPEKQRTLKK
ncbi:hypothetical protein BDP27DRAFT_1402013 [Rhodocollybia butyracea]|uniref:Ribosome assembly protein 1 n=1 Tax=Rhodocollybia butyracea TaxID=206335 RepID=A0A9P5PYI7_9AGAR|nr:hypothetical protein BDP27DRAFT_1402013 [Rhodocollybia butyracea]